MESAAAIWMAPALAGLRAWTAWRARATARRSCSACGLRARPAADSPRPGPRSKRGTPSELSRARMRALTAGCVSRSASAARRNPPKVPTARNASICPISAAGLLSKLWIAPIKIAAYRADRNNQFDRARPGGDSVGADETRRPATARAGNRRTHSRRGARHDLHLPVRHERRVDHPPDRMPGVRDGLLPELCDRRRRAHPVSVVRRLGRMLKKAHLLCWRSSHLSLFWI